MLKVKIVSTRVRTARDGGPSGTPRRCRGASPAAAGSRSVRRQGDRAPGSRAERDEDGLTENGQAVPAANRAAPTEARASWLTVTKPVWIRALASGEVLALHQHRQQGLRGVVSEHLGRAEQEERRRARRRSRPIPVHDRYGDDARGRTRASRVDRHDRAAGPAGRTAPRPTARTAAAAATGRAPRGHEEGVVRLGGDEQRPGGEREAVAEVADPRRPQQPAEPDAES